MGLGLILILGLGAESDDGKACERDGVEYDVACDREGVFFESFIGADAIGVVVDRSDWGRRTAGDMGVFVGALWGAWRDDGENDDGNAR